MAVIRSARQAKKTRRGLIVLNLILGVILLGLVTLVLMIPENPEQLLPMGQTEPAPVLTLPEVIDLLAPTLPVFASVEATDFVSGLDDTGISVSFAEEPVTETGEQVVTLLFSDGTANCTQQTICYFFDMELSAVVDVTENHMPSVRDFVADENVQVSFAGRVTLDSPGQKNVTLLCDGKSYAVIYIVKESNPPEGTSCEITAEIGTVPNPATLVENILDESEVTVTYKEQPVLTTVGEYVVTLILTDAYGNEAEVDSLIHVIPAVNAPRFEGLDDLKISVGDAVSYKKGVDAIDPQDGSVSFTVDAHGVDRDQVGTYVAYYSATDSEGNTTIVPRKIIVQTMDQVKMEELACKILDTIITENMTRDQQIQAVYQYARYNIRYVGTSNKESVWLSAYEGLTTGRGDCYTYYAVNRVFLDLLGIENLEVQRVGGTSNHWWNLVLHEDGFYYHVDSTPAAVKVNGVFHGKMTESDIEAYTNDKGVVNRRPNFYVYDKTLPEYEGINIAP